MRERSVHRPAFATSRMPDRKPSVDTRIAPARRPCAGLHHPVMPRTGRVHSAETSQPRWRVADSIDGHLADRDLQASHVSPANSEWHEAERTEVRRSPSTSMSAPPDDREGPGQSQNPIFERYRTPITPASCTGQADRTGSADGCQKLGPGRQIVSQDSPGGVSRFGGQAGTQDPDPTPASGQTTVSRAGSTYPHPSCRLGALEVSVGGLRICAQISASAGIVTGLASSFRWA